MPVTSFFLENGLYQILEKKILLQMNIYWSVHELNDILQKYIQNTKDIR